MYFIHTGRANRYAIFVITKCIFSFGISIKSWPVMFIGRLVFGFGGESLIVANSALLADWFKGTMYLIVYIYIQTYIFFS